MILIYSEQKTERLQYTLSLIFNSILEVDFELTDDKTSYNNSRQPKINYSDHSFPDGLQLKPHSLLFETGISVQSIQSFTEGGMWYFFPTTASFLPFDIFACSFFIVSRYEEYLYSGESPHGRFPAIESIQYKNGVLDQPVVNQWARLLATKVSATYPNFAVPQPVFHFLMTIDVDNAWAYKNKPFWILGGSAIRSIMKAEFRQLMQQLKVLFHQEEDPYDSFDFIETTMADHPDQLKFFFLLGNRSSFDRNISHRNKKLQKLIRHLSMQYETGIHPSYASNQKKGLLTTEIKRLEKIIRQPVTNSRQHYLKMTLPTTYEQLSKAGIKNDYTMGYADATGFRAGLCTPFLFFNLKKNETTPLSVYPLQVMDTSLKDYLNLAPEEGQNRIQYLMEQVKEVGGTFIALFHNESIGNKGTWDGWREVFQQVVKTGIDWGNE